MTARDAPHVSVIVPARNEASRIGAALASVHASEGIRIDIIVVDDGSTDATADVVAALGDARIRILSTSDEARGVSPARNLGLAAARGRWVAFLDADDAWGPGRLDAILEAADRHAADFVADDVLIESIHPDTDMVSPVSTLLTDRGLSAPVGGGPLSLDDFVRHDLGILKPVIARSLIVDHGLRFGDHTTEDFAFWFQCLRVASTPVILGTPTYRHRRDVDRVTLSTPTRAFWVGAAHTTVQLLADPTIPRRVAALLERRARVEWRRGAYLTFKEDLRARRVGSALARAIRLPSILVVPLEGVRVRARRRRSGPHHRDPA
jgi:succinoglycan biosynthesis protein ExoO